MTDISKRDALQLAADVKRVLIAGHAIAVRTDTGAAGAYAGFVGGLESVFAAFVGRHAGSDARDALVAAFNYSPTEAEIAEHNAHIAKGRREAGGEGALDAAIGAAS